MSGTTWVYIFLGLYIVYCFYWGLKGYFTEKTSSGYAIAGRSIPCHVDSEDFHATREIELRKLAEEALRRLMDIKLFIDADADVRVLRRLVPAWIARARESGQLRRASEAQAFETLERSVRRGDADEGAPHTAVPHQFAEHMLRRVCRDGETDSLRPKNDRGVDSNHLPFHIE